MGEPFGLDMGAVMELGVAIDSDVAMLAEVLPSIEAAVLAGFDEDGGDEGD